MARHSLLSFALGAQLSLSLLASSPPALSAAEFDDHFTGRTLRLDYTHAGTAGEERIALDRLRLEGEWPGSRTRLLDTSNLGKYLFVVCDLATNVPLYTRGFSSIYGEWETTAEARAGHWRGIEESLRFPEPRGPFQAVVKKRANDGAFREIASFLLDPAGRSVDRTPLASDGEVWTLLDSGPAATKLDLLIVGDGYSTGELPKLRKDAERLASALLDVEPFHSRRGDINIRVLATPSSDSGVTDPRGGAWKSTPFALSFNAFDSDRYILTFRDRALREAAASAPYDALVFVGNTRKYGGGGIFNLWATCTADTSTSTYVFIHELGHSIAGLADEYYTSQVAYEAFTPPGVEPWEPNITALRDPSQLKWRDLRAADTPIPTPWSQAHYDEVSLAYQKRRQELTDRGAPVEAMEALFEEVKASTAPLLDSETYAHRVGAFEGAGYEAKGLYRPEIDCIMFSRNRLRFCTVCSRAIHRAIDLHSR